MANIDKKVEREDVRNFFEQLCGECCAAGCRILAFEFITDSYSPPFIC